MKSKYPFDKLRKAAPFAPGTFYCYGPSGLRVTYSGTDERGAELFLGLDDALPIYVDAHSAGVLSKFFEQLGEQLATQESAPVWAY